MLLMTSSGYLLIAVMTFMVPETKSLILNHLQRSPLSYRFKCCATPVISGFVIIDCLVSSHYWSNIKVIEVKNIGYILEPNKNTKECIEAHSGKGSIDMYWNGQETRRSRYLPINIKYN